MHSLRLPLALFFSLTAPSALAQSAAECATIDFETIPGTTATDGLEINAQFADSLGFTFALEDGTSPRLAQVGNPTTAFEPADTPDANQGIGTFFLTDDGLITSNSSPSPLIVAFTIPVDSAGGAILDIDFSETFTIQARDANDTVLEEIVLTAGDAGTGSGKATPWTFGRPTPDVASIRFVGFKPSGVFGLGFDLFTTCAPGRVTSTEPGIDSAEQQVWTAPNPSRAAMRIDYELAQSTPVRLEVFSMQGRRVAVLADGRQPAGRHTVTWEPKEVPPGTYMYRLRAGAAQVTGRLTLVR